MNKITNTSSNFETVLDSTNKPSFYERNITPISSSQLKPRSIINQEMASPYYNNNINSENSNNFLAIDFKDDVSVTLNKLESMIQVIGEPSKVFLFVSPCRSGSSALLNSFAAGGYDAIFQPIKTALRRVLVSDATPVQIKSNSKRALVIKETLGPFYDIENKYNPLDVVRRLYPNKEISVVTMLRNPDKCANSWNKNFKINGRRFDIREIGSSYNETLKIKDQCKDLGIPCHLIASEDLSSEDGFKKLMQAINLEYSEKMINWEGLKCEEGTSYLFQKPYEPGPFQTPGILDAIKKGNTYDFKLSKKNEQNKEIESYSPIEVEAIEKAKSIYTQLPYLSKDITKISIIGASGKVGRQVVHNLFNHEGIQNYARINLISKNKNKLKGLLMDLESAAYIDSDNCKSTNAFSISDEIESIAGSDLAIICSAKWPSPEDKIRLNKIDPEGRLSQAYSNYPVINNITYAIKKYASSSIDVLVVTNQSDLLAEAMRNTLPPEHVIGFGLSVDNARYNLSLQNNSGTTNNSFLVGYHCDLLVQINERNSNSSNIDALTKTKEFGTKLSKLQKDNNYPEINTGSSILPGISLSKTVLAYSGASPSMRSYFNIRLPKHYTDKLGINKEIGIGIPMNVSKGKFNIDNNVCYSETEKNNIAVCVDTFNQRYNNFAEQKRG